MIRCEFFCLFVFLISEIHQISLITRHVVLVTEKLSLTKRIRYKYEVFEICRKYDDVSSIGIPPDLKSDSY